MTYVVIPCKLNSPLRWDEQAHETLVSRKMKTVKNLGGTPQLQERINDNGEETDHPAAGKTIQHAWSCLTEHSQTAVLLLTPWAAFW